MTLPRIHTGRFDRDRLSPRDLDQTSPSFVGERIVLDETHEAEVFGPDHPIVEGLIELEIDQLVDLGDNEPDARAWLVDRNDTVWMALFAQGAPRTAEHVEGRIRLTGTERSHRMIDDPKRGTVSGHAGSGGAHGFLQPRSNANVG